MYSQSVIFEFLQNSSGRPLAMCSAKLTAISNSNRSTNDIHVTHTHTHTHTCGGNEREKEGERVTGCLCPFHISGHFDTFSEWRALTPLQKRTQA